MYISIIFCGKERIYGAGTKYKNYEKDIERFELSQLYTTFIYYLDYSNSNYKTLLH